MLARAETSGHCIILYWQLAELSRSSVWRPNGKSACKTFCIDFHCSYDSRNHVLTFPLISMAHVGLLRGFACLCLWLRELPNGGGLLSSTNSSGCPQALQYFCPPSRETIPEARVVYIRSEFRPPSSATYTFEGSHKSIHACSSIYRLPFLWILLDLIILTCSSIYLLLFRTSINPSRFITYGILLPHSRN